MKKSLSTFPGSQWVIVILLLLLGLAGGFSPLGKMLDRYAYDRFFLSREPQPPPADVLIIAIDEASFQILRQRWPWPRTWHAALIDVLKQKGARTIAFDLIFSEPGSREDDEAFARGMAEHGRVVLAMTQDTLETGQYASVTDILPLDLFTASAEKTGLDIMPLDPDGILRRCFLYFNGKPSLALQSARSFLATEAPLPGKKSPVFEHPVLIPFLGPPGTIHTLSYHQILNQPDSFPDGCFRDKLVMVGFKIKNPAVPSSLSSDHYPTPFVRSGAGYTAGVEIQASIAAGLVHGRVPQAASPFLLWSSALLIWLLAGLTSFRTSPLRAIIIFPVALFSVVCLCDLLFVSKQIFLAPAMLILPAGTLFAGGLGFRFKDILKEKQFIRAAFSRYLSPSLVQHLVSHPEKLKLGGEVVNGTVLFLDIEKFTRLTLTFPPRELAQILNQTLGRFSDMILDRQGTIDKIAGDALMAVWGNPQSHPDHAAMACRTALEIQKEVQKAIEEHQGNNIPAVNIRIGINSGKMLAGNIGGRQFSNYTVHGVDVNLGARLETANKLYDTRVLIGENTANLLSDEFIIRPLDIIELEGWDDPVRVFELMGTKNRAEPDLERLAPVFAQARELYLQRRFIEAKTLFREALAIKPDDGPSKIFIRRCTQFVSSPPEHGWNGVYRPRQPDSTFSLTKPE